MRDSHCQLLYHENKQVPTHGNNFGFRIKNFGGSVSMIIISLELCLCAADHIVESKPQKSTLEETLTVIRRAAVNCESSLNDQLESRSPVDDA